MGKQWSRAGLLEDADYEQLAVCFRLLGNSNALKLIVALGSEHCTVTDLTTRTGLAQPLVSRRLSALRRRGFLRSQRAGKHTYYWVTSKDVHDLLRRMHKQMSAADPLSDPPDTRSTGKGPTP